MIADPDAARTEVVAVARRMTADGLVVGTSGNVSCRCATATRDDLVAVTPSGVDYATMTPDDVCVVDLDGVLVDGVLRPTSELPLHRACYRHPDAGAVVHTHSTAAVAVSLLADEVPLVHYQTAMFGGPVAVTPYAPFGSDALAGHVAAALAGRSAAVMRHHGTVVRAPSLSAAYDGARQLEWMCDVWLRASAVGPPALLEPPEIEEIVGRMAGYGQPG